jgi:acetyl-CoA C-acetyltransferase
VRQASTASRREAQDQYAITSTTARQGRQRGRQLRLGDGARDAAQAKGDTVIRYDEQPFKAKLDKIPGLKPAFKKDGTITAANASSISDGAAALVLMRESTAARRAWRRWPASSATRCTRRRPSGSPPRRPAPSTRC